MRIKIALQVIHWVVLGAIKKFESNMNGNSRLILMKAIRSGAMAHILCII